MRTEPSADPYVPGHGDLRYAVDATFGAKNPPYDVFRYFMGVCRTILMQRADVARKLLEAPDA